MNKRINIAIDGHSSCGKSTLAKALAKSLNYIYIDTGAMYRAVTLYALQNKSVGSKGLLEDKLTASLDNMYITFKYNSDTHHSDAYLNGKNIEKEIRSMQVSKYVSEISEVKAVRDKLVRLQRRMSELGGVVMDGRDIGTVVLPDAHIKFFMTADLEVRAQRRFDELRERGVEVSFNEVLENVTKRDKIDSSRLHSPLKQAEDAIVVDNTDLTIEEQFQFILAQVHKKLEELDASPKVSSN